MVVQIWQLCFPRLSRFSRQKFQTFPAILCSTFKVLIYVMEVFIWKSIDSNNKYIQKILWALSVKFPDFSSFSLAQILFSTYQGLSDFGQQWNGISKTNVCIIRISDSAHGFDTKTLNIFKSYLNQIKQFVNINGTLRHIFKILSGVPQVSILGPILFNIFINNLLLHIKSTDTHNYADENILSAYSDTVIEVIKLNL